MYIPPRIPHLVIAIPPQWGDIHLVENHCPTDIKTEHLIDPNFNYTPRFACMNGAGGGHFVFARGALWVPGLTLINHI